jgi:hypothetical protein
MTDGLFAVQYWVLVSSLALRGMATGSHLITNDNAAWQRVISLFVRVLTCCAPLVVETLLAAWFYHQTQASPVVGLDEVEPGDGR